MSKLLFKGDEYTLCELIEFRSKNKNIFKSGDVVDTNSGEVVDIQDLEKLRDRYMDEIMHNIYVITDNKNNKLKWAIDKNVRDLRLSKLELKFKNKNINLDELQELIKLKKQPKRESFSINYNNFISLNVDKRLPDIIDRIDRSRFYDMIYYLSYDNILKKTPRKNGKIIKKENLMDFLDIKTYKSYRRFIRLMIKNNVIRELSTTNKSKVIIINPVYANKNIRIDYTTYLCFKEDIKPFLTDEEMYFIELLGCSDELNTSYEIV